MTTERILQKSTLKRVEVLFFTFHDTQVCACSCIFNIYYIINKKISRSKF